MAPRRDGGHDDAKKKDDTDEGEESGDHVEDSPMRPIALDREALCVLGQEAIRAIQ